MLEIFWVIHALNDHILLAWVFTIVVATRILMIVINKFPLKSVNFYGKYIFGLSAAFVIILITTKLDINTYFLLLVFLGECFVVFKNDGNKQVVSELLSTDNSNSDEIKFNIVTNVIYWLTMVIAALIIIIYANHGLLESIFAPIAVMVGLAMVLLYYPFSHNYSKGIIKQAQSKFDIEEIISRISVNDLWKLSNALIIFMFYVSLIFIKLGAGLTAALAALLGIIIMVVRIFVKHENFDVENEISWPLIVGYTVLAIALFVV